MNFWLPIIYYFLINPWEVIFQILDDALSKSVISYSNYKIIVILKDSIAYLIWLNNMLILLFLNFLPFWFYWYVHTKAVTRYNNVYESDLLVYRISIFWPETLPRIYFPQRKKGLIKTEKKYYFTNPDAQEHFLSMCI